MASGISYTFLLLLIGTFYTLLLLIISYSAHIYVQSSKSFIDNFSRVACWPISFVLYSMMILRTHPCSLWSYENISLRNEFKTSTQMFELIWNAFVFAVVNGLAWGAQMGCYSKGGTYTQVYIAKAVITVDDCIDKCVEEVMCCMLVGLLCMRYFIFTCRKTNELRFKVSEYFLLPHQNIPICSRDKFLKSCG